VTACSTTSSTCFFGAALLFWWPVIDAAPHLRPSPSYAARIVYLVLAAFQTAALGLLLTVAPVVLYPSYTRGPHPPWWSALEDQAWGGILMWGGGGLVDMVAIAVLLHRALGAGREPLTFSERARSP
jgi:cytochrome c oxidase assembly factor CtaG